MGRTVDYPGTIEFGRDKTSIYFEDKKDYWKHFKLWVMWRWVNSTPAWQRAA